MSEARIVDLNAGYDVRALKKNKFVPAGTVVTPGMLLDYDANGKVIPHAAATTHVNAKFADADFNEYDGLAATYGSATDTDDTQIAVLYFSEGLEVNALLAAGQSVTAGALLVPAAGGALAAKGETDTPSFIALEAVDNSSGSAPVHIAVEVI